MAAAGSGAGAAIAARVESRLDAKPVIIFSDLEKNSGLINPANPLHRCRSPPFPPYFHALPVVH